MLLTAAMLKQTGNVRHAEEAEDPGPEDTRVQRMPRSLQAAAWNLLKNLASVLKAH